MRIISSVILILCCCFGDAFGQQSQNEPPKLIVGIVVEQMRPEYLNRFSEKFRKDGFNLLLKRGAHFTNVRIDQLIQKQATGMATLYTGAIPSIHGVVDDNWYDRLTGKTINSISDDYYITVGSDSQEGNCSASQLMVETLGDRLKLESAHRSQVFSVALNNHSAVMSAGHTANGAYWLDTQTGHMISSSYYVSEFPNWVRDFNAKEFAADYLNRSWTPLLPESSYKESLADDYILEKGFYGRWNTFPYDLKKLQKRAESFKPLKATPFGNTMVKDFALQLIDNEKLGQDDVTDLLTVVFSTFDYENMAFEPLSMETEDLYLRLDREIALLVNHLNKKVGEGQYLLFLTSNVSSSFSPGYLKEECRMSVGEFAPKSAIALLKSYLNITYGQADWIVNYSEHQLYFDHKLLEEKKIDRAEMQRAAATFLNQFKGVKMAVPASILHHGNGHNSILSPFAHSYNYRRSGDVFYSLEQGWRPVFKYKRKQYTENSIVPLIFYGAGVKNGRYSESVTIRSVVPTICSYANLAFPENATAKPLPISW